MNSMAQRGTLFGQRLLLFSSYTDTDRFIQIQNIMLLDFNVQQNLQVLNVHTKTFMNKIRKVGTLAIVGLSIQ